MSEFNAQAVANTASDFPKLDQLEEAPAAVGEPALDDDEDDDDDDLADSLLRDFLAPGDAAEEVTIHYILGFWKSERGRCKRVRCDLTTSIYIYNVNI